MPSMVPNKIWALSHGILPSSFGEADVAGFPENPGSLVLGPAWATKSKNPFCAQPEQQSFESSRPLAALAGEDGAILSEGQRQEGGEAPLQTLASF